MLGYFSIIGLLRVHCLLGDYTLALKMMDNIELNKKVWFKGNYSYFHTIRIIDYIKNFPNRLCLHVLPHVMLQRIIMWGLHI